MRIIMPCRDWFRPCAVLAVLVLSVGTVTASGQAGPGGAKDDSGAASRPGPETGPKPPSRRALEGDEARRAEELEKAIARAQGEGRFGEAVGPAREVLAIRRRVQGEDHWETVSARIEAETMARAAGLPGAVRSDLASGFRQADEADALYEAGRYAEAERL